MEILVEFIFTISVERSRSEYRLIFCGGGKLYSPVVTFMNRELNKAFKNKTQRIIYGGLQRFFICLFPFSWAEFIILKNLIFLLFIKG